MPNPRSTVRAPVESLLSWVHSPSAKRLLGLWPWLLLLIYASWATAPLWKAEGLVFAGKFSSDNAVSAWYYGWVARSLEEGTSLEMLSDFNYPNPWPRSVEFPNVLDATLTAPLWWIFGWPRGWGASQAVTVFVSGFGCAAMARALGCRGLGVLISGMLGVLCRQIWKDLVNGRMNAVWPGLALLSLAALLIAIERPQGPQQSRRPIHRTTWALAAAALGALAAGVYPPYLLLLAPAGLLLIVDPLRKTDRLGWLLLATGLGLGLALGWGTISSILASRDAGAGLGGCPSQWSALAGKNLFLQEAAPQQGLSLPGMASGSWMLMGLVLLHRRRLAGLGLLVWIGLLMVLSLGPCPQSSEGLDLPWQGWPVLSSWLPVAWDRLAPINDWGRMATVAGLLAAICAGMGIEQLWQWKWPGKAVALLLSSLALHQAHQVVMTERLDSQKWHAVPAPDSALFLQTAEIGPVADLPFDRKQQFLSVLWAPDHPRINPLRPADHPPADPFIEWLYSLGKSGGDFVMELGDPRGVEGLKIQCTKDGRALQDLEVGLVGNQLRVSDLDPKSQCSGILTGIQAAVPRIASGMSLRCTIKNRQANCSETIPSPHQVQASGIRWVIVDQKRCGPPWMSPPACGPEGKQAMKNLLGEPLDRSDGMQVWDLSR